MAIPLDITIERHLEVPQNNAELLAATGIFAAAIFRAKDTRHNRQLDVYLSSKYYRA
jgi:hypothetical protein